MLKLRQGQAQDAEALSNLAHQVINDFELDAATLIQAKSLATFNEQHFPLYYFGLVEDPMLIGFYALHFVSKEQIELKALYVQTEHQRKGYGRVLLNHAKIQSKILESKELVVASTKEAEGFFEKIGAKNCGSSILTLNNVFSSPMVLEL